MKDHTFEWKGKKVVTYGDIADAMLGLESQEEAIRFRDAHRLTCDTPAIADSNLGYLCGYFDSRMMVKLLGWLEVGHPVFGTTAPSPRAALEAGRRAGEAES